MSVNESRNIGKIGLVDDPKMAAGFDTEGEAAQAYDIAANELFKRINKESFDKAFLTDIGISDQVDDFDYSLTCPWCNGSVLTLFTIDGSEKLCWDCFNDRVMNMIWVMTPENPRWDEFITKMKAKSKGVCGGEFRVNGEGSRINPKSFAVKTLRAMKMDVSQSIEYFWAHGASCDCEILFNIEEDIQRF